jgi:short-subunit dehydrogenase
MKERNHGKILFFSSPGPYLEPCYEAITGAYRSFVYSFISGLRKELNETEIQITDLLPFLNDLIHFEKIDFIRSPEKFSVEIFNALMSGKKHIIEPHLTHKFENFFKNTLFDYPSKFFLN